VRYCELTDRMLPFTLRTWPIALWLLALASSLPAQEPGYMVVRCVKTLHGQAAGYRYMILETVAEAMRARVAKAQIHSWGFARSVIPAGEEARCDFLLFDVYEGFPPQPIDPYFEKSGGLMATDGWQTRASSQSKLVSVELWQDLDKTGSVETGSYLRVNQIKNPPGEFDNWARMQSEIWKPVHEARIRDGDFQGWLASRVIMPSGADWPNPARTISVFADWKSLNRPARYRELMPAVHPGKNPEEILTGIANLQEILRTEVFEVIEWIRRPAK
jgi:hypothetical protein